MTGRIPQPFIEELLRRADIVEVIGARVTLKKAGANYKGLCPFHGEKTPSFTVSPTKAFYHCFGCGAHGSVFDFLMNHDNLSFPEAVEALAEMWGLEVPRGEEPEQRGANDEIYAVLREADQLYRAALRDSETAIGYLKGRGIDGATAGRFGIGYAPDAWDALLRALGTSQSRTAALVQAGLIVEKDGRHYDRFRNRIMFPIRDARGRVVGFGGRVLDTSEPKYLNSPETPVFDKSQTLYGLYEARGEQPGRPKTVIVVEGYLDVASLAQHGVGQVVATLGTATTAGNIRRLTRLTDCVVFCFDGDRAGRAAAWKAMETALPYGGGAVELAFLLLPEGEDPDSFVRKHGAEEFRSLAARAAPLSDFFVSELFESAGGRSFRALGKPLLEKLPAGVYKAEIMNAVAGRLGIPAPQLEHLLTDEPLETARARPAARRTGRRTLVQNAIALALHYPRAAASLEPVEGLELVDQPGVPLARRVLESAREIPQVTTASLLERLRDDPEARYLDRLVSQTPIDDEDAAPVVLKENLERIVRDFRRHQVALELKNRPIGGLTD